MAGALKVFALLAGIWAVVAAVSVLQTSMMGIIGVREAAWLSLIEWGPWIIVSPLVVWLAARVSITSSHWKIPLVVHVLCSVAVTIAIDEMLQFVRWPGGPVGGITIMATPIPAPVDGDIARPRAGVVFGAEGAVTHMELPLFEKSVLPPPPPPPRAPAWLFRARLTMPIYWLVVASVHAWRYHRASLERERRARLAENQLTEARLKALQAQLQPHFLFNSLNTISAFIHTQPAAADEMVCALSELLRSVLAYSDRAEVTLREELDLTDRYLLIHRIRFRDALRVRWSLDAQAFDAVVPALLLQPLIENALRHGLRNGPGTVEIMAQTGNDRLAIQIVDHSDQPESPPTSAAAVGPIPQEGVGLRNTRSRLQTLYGDDHRLDLVRVPGGMRVEIEMPLRRADA